MDRGSGMSGFVTEVCTVLGCMWVYEITFDGCLTDPRCVSSCSLLFGRLSYYTGRLRAIHLRLVKYDKQLVGDAY